MASLSSSELLWKWVDYGIDYRLERSPRFRRNFYPREDEYIERAKMEVGVINGKDFPDYFLVTSDLIRWAKDRPEGSITIGPGRGSAAGSFVCYALRITEIDPVPNPLMLFERFIDPGRPDYPDIDIDVADHKRHLLVERLVDLYGRDYVANIGNYLRYRGKTALETVANVYTIPSYEIADVKKLVVDRPDGDAREENSFEDTVEAFAEAQALVRKHPELKYAYELEGDYKSLGTHAAGIVISNTPIEDICAVYQRTKADGTEMSVISYDKRDAERQGVLKLDLLGLANMGIVDDCISWVPELTLEGMYELELDDEKTLEGFRNGNLAGIFQYSGRTTRGITKRIYERTIGMEAENPISFDTLADINALSRPGSLISGMTDKYIAVENGKAQPEKFHPVVDNILGSSHGCLVYQEQVMKIGSELGGFPGDKVGALRKIIGKKTAGGAFEAYYEEFAKGAMELHGMPEKTARVIWDYMAASASYLFNVAHSVSYAVIAYWMMWLKVHYPAEFYAASLRRAKKTKDKDPALELMQAAVRDGIKVLPPDLRFKHQLTWTPDHTYGPKFQRIPAVQAGFTQIPGVGESMAQAIIDYQTGENRNGEFAMKWKELQYTPAKKKKQRFPCTPYMHTLPSGKVVTRDWVSEDVIAEESKGVPGLGKTTLDKIIAWTEKDDPFDIHLAERSCAMVYTAINRGKIPLDLPTADGTYVASAPDKEVVFIGIVNEVRIIDIIESERKRTGLTAEEVRATLTKHPDKTTKAKLITTDHTGVEVHINIDRIRYPQFAEDIESITPRVDVVHVQGRTRDGYGATIQADYVSVIDLSGE
ncbi:DNA polymerase III alpha subunit [Rhodococcus phage ChewyVIII]|uniref:DNA polymerase III alpha subunit n=1 Tax=Rhodococcus phage ChewyVIII TaxID=1887657 RepID=A0A1C9EI69_9CAUD|nr:DNA polymerase III alpha subunit [Rhodococcus phage ChewyVIII]AON97491.1 DNA polymerase III alpha subunit [Rhodococcus phage ChewyVIII]